eukprot:2026474-Rhodomonas_salina.2
MVVSDEELTGSSPPSCFRSNVLQCCASASLLRTLGSSVLAGEVRGIKLADVRVHAALIDEYDADK